MTTRIAITGLGVLSPVGCQPSTILSALQTGRSGIAPVSLYPSQHLVSRVAGEVADIPEPVRSCDRTEQMALSAACQAWESADLPQGQITKDRVGLAVGASGAGLSHHSADDVFKLQFQPYQQAVVIACELDIQGPVVMFTSASVGSGLALVHAMDLLRSGICDLVVAGGAECLSQVNHESMDGMRLCSVAACSPFSGQPGLTVGEGGAFFVLERMDDAIARNAPIRVELFGYGVTKDGYDIVTGDPSGEGLARAFQAALVSSGVLPSEIHWIKANGTSNRDQDIAETLAVRHIFPVPPPVTGIESFIGHANGAAPALGLGLAIISFENSWLPPTLNFGPPRSGCNLDYVPNQGRPSNAEQVLASSVAFGGSNVALVFGKPRKTFVEGCAKDGLCITGVGVVSPFGLGFECFISGLKQGLSAIRHDSNGFLSGFAMELRNQRLAAKSTLLQQFAIAAATEAIKGSQIALCDLDRVGVFVGLCRGSAAARAQYAAALMDEESRRGIGKIVVRMGRFTVASSLSQCFRLRGYGATISEGFGAGLHALAHACVHLENSSTEDALLVLAADETGPGPAGSLREMNWLASGHDGCFLRPYDPHSTGTVPGEGAVALVVERASVAQKRGANVLAYIQGLGLTSGKSTVTLVNAIRNSIAQAGMAPADISAAYGNGSGIWQQDEIEIKAIRQVLPAKVPTRCVNSGLGFAESASGLFHVAAALDENHTRLLLTARTEGHRNAALVLGR